MLRALNAWLPEDVVVRQVASVDQSFDPRRHAVRRHYRYLIDNRSVRSALDRERAAGRTRGPLHGIPVLLKDNIDTADRMSTTAGSLALEGSIPLRDSHVAERLRAAGAPNLLVGEALVRAPDPGALLREMMA